MLAGSRFSRRAVAALAVLVWACGAGNSPPSAAAQPRASAPAAVGPAATLGAPQRAGAIGAFNVSRVKKLWEVAAGGRGRAVAVSRKLRQVAVSSGSPVRLYDFYSGKPAGKIHTCEDVIRSGLSYQQHQLVVVCESGVRLYAGTKPARRDLPVHESRITAASFAWPKLALGHHDGVVRIYGLDGSDTIEIPVPGPPIDVKSLALTPDGSRVAIAWVQGSIWWWDTAQPDVPHKLVRNENESDTLAWSDDGARLAEEGRVNFTTVWGFGADPPVPAAEVKNGDWVKRILFTRDGKFLVRGGSDGLELAEIDGPHRVVLDTRGSVEDVATDDPGAVIAAVDRDGRLTFWTVK